MKILIGLALFVLMSANHAHAELQLTFIDPSLTDSNPLKLESYEYLPKTWNGKVIVMSHGSTGGNKNAIKTSLKFVNISKLATDNGYIFVAYMRKGRGKSEGNFTEESGKCDYSSLTQEVREAELQLAQVITKVREVHSVEKVILMGHSRGGFLSSVYAHKNPSQVLAVVNLAGAWSAACESRNGGFGRRALEASGKAFKPQLWAYFQNDSYFQAKTFNDSDYSWFSNFASKNGVTFKVFSDGGRTDGTLGGGGAHVKIHSQTRPLCA